MSEVMDEQRAFTFPDWQKARRMLSGGQEALPIHETAVCPQCSWAGVTIRGELLDCHQCDYRWRWPLGVGMVGLD